MVQYMDSSWQGKINGELPARALTTVDYLRHNSCVPEAFSFWYVSLSEDVENRSKMTDQTKTLPEQLAQLYLIARDYEAGMLSTSDPGEKWRLRGVLQELRTCILRLENKQPPARA